MQVDQKQIVKGINKGGSKTHNVQVSQIREDKLDLDEILVRNFEMSVALDYRRDKQVKSDENKESLMKSDNS